jgi:hypothetical protein
MRPATFEEARVAKEILAAKLFELPELRGIGIALLEDGFGVKVNLRSMPDSLIVPDEIDGVPVIVEIVDTIRPL